MTRRGRAGCWVYPRERGGTVSYNRICAILWGLSPRTRGNPLEHYPMLTHHGSIPANAGEPIPERGSPMVKGVYPRERGGTFRRARGRGQWRGLSPRTRGNPGQATGPAGRSRSIPANAGEPPARRCLKCSSTVYPRERGGTPMPSSNCWKMAGLSPRTRGNLIWRKVGQPISGSIPANAGEPRPLGQGQPASGVYPRERGGTASSNCSAETMRGLSPRTRGNLALD